MKQHFFLLAAFCAVLISCEKPQKEAALPRAMVLTVTVDGIPVVEGGSVGDVSLQPRMVLDFSREIVPDDVALSAITYSGGSLSGLVEGTALILTPTEALAPFTRYRLSVPAGAGFGVDLLEGVSFSFVTAYDAAPKFDRLPDDELLTLVQEKTFSYFWDYAHPVSGLARERLGSDNTVTTGGSGFGLMGFPVAVERGFVSREAAAGRLRTIVSFLLQADRFHGVFPHWMDGTTGKVIPFSSNDNGADLVETAFLMEGLLTAARYFDAPTEADIRAGIRTLWEEVEWDWFTRGEQVLYWHWSPDKQWAMNMPITGWNEGLIVYVLAASSPTHSIAPEVYHAGWAHGGTLVPSTSGPLFFAHYSFLGLDPRNLQDPYASYWDQNVAHARYNYAYCVRNPKGHGGYSDASWGLTASDYPKGYTASSPSHDTGTIAPTAAIASFPYTPEESLKALRQFYYVYGDRLWGKYGFYDAFNLDNRWFATSYIAIDQGPIVAMLENYRTGLLWNLFMQDTDVQRGLQRLGFTSW